MAETCRFFSGVAAVLGVALGLRCWFCVVVPWLWLCVFSVPFMLVPVVAQIAALVDVAFGACGVSLLLVLCLAASSRGSASRGSPACVLAFRWRGVMGAAVGVFGEVPSIINSQNALLACGRCAHGVMDDGAPRWC